MTKAQWIASIDKDLERQVELAAARANETPAAWIEHALREKLDEQRRVIVVEDTEISMAPPGAKPKPLAPPVKLRGGKTMAETVVEDRGPR